MGRPRLKHFVSKRLLLVLYYFICHFGVVYATYWFYLDVYVLLFVMTLETYLSIFGGYENLLISHYLLLSMHDLFVTNVSFFTH